MIPLPKGDYGYPSVGEFYFPNVMMSEKFFGFESDWNRIEEERLKTVAFCMRNGIPVPKMHGPENRKRVGEALYFMKEILNQKEEDEACACSCCSDY